MKTPLRHLTLLLIATGLNAIALHAQNAAPKPQPPGARDPFHKERGAPTEAPSFSENLVSITTIFESYLLKREDAVSLLSSPPDAAARYQRINELVAAGNARLEDIQASAGKSNMRTLIESVDVVMTALNFQPPAASEEPALPASFRELPYGDRLELEPILSTDGRACNLSFSISSKRLLGLGEIRAGRRAQPQPSATVENREIVTSVSLRVGQPVLLGTRSRPPASSGETAEIGVVFGRVLVSKERPEAAMPPSGPVGYAEHLLSFYSVDRAAARAVLETEIKPGASFQAVQTLLQKKQAKLEHMVSLPTQTGMRAKADENVISYQPGGTASGVGLSEPSKSSELPAKAAGEDTAAKPGAAARVPYYPALSGKNLGLSVELETVIGPSDALLKGAPLVADLNLLISWRADAGNLQGPAALAPYPETGVAESRKIQCMISCYAGVPTFLGTLNPPRDNGVNGRKDSGRVWLVFVQVTPVKP